MVVLFGWGGFCWHPPLVRNSVGPLPTRIVDYDTITYDEFRGILMTILYWYAPMKEKIIRADNAP